MTVKYHYEETLVESEVVNFNPQYVHWSFDPEPETIDHYVTVGTMEIIVNDSSSLTIQNVIGYQSRGGNGGIQASIEASMSVPFIIEFDNGYMSWPDSVLDSSTNYYTFENSELSDNAFAALGSLEDERSVTDETLDGGEDDEDLYGSRKNDSIDGRGGDDTIYAGSGSDILIGGTGGDYLNGGSGTDTASYENATEGVRIRLYDDNFRAGEAVGDELVSIENLKGSAFDDRLYGDENANTIHGGAGNDRLTGGRYGEGDALFGEAGDDEITGLIGNDLLDGGEGNDELKAGSGNDTLLGGAGDDVLISDGNIVDIVEVLSPGSDILDGGSGTDTAEFYHEGGLVVDLAAGRADFGGTEDFATLKNIENVHAGRGDDIIYGDDQNNVLNGDDGDDVIYGGGGDDTLIGGDGDDELYGGAGLGHCKDQRGQFNRYF